VKQKNRQFYFFSSCKHIAIVVRAKHMRQFFIGQNIEYKISTEEREI